MPPPDTLQFTDLLRKHLGSAHREVLTLEGYRQAGVLVPVIPAPEGPALLLTKRTEDVETHKGQVSFPGGVTDEGDRDIIHTALRETEEEVGIGPTGVEVLGVLDDLATPTGFVITPIVGVLAPMPALKVNQAEVAEVLVVPVAFFLNPANGHSEQRLFRGKYRDVWFYGAGDQQIWGATAMIIRSLLHRLGLL
jgi:8-oxo-dGTP pyrophosphatase MutT (NUDIX family)